MIKLINGDCLEEMDKLIEQDIKFDAIITDPPYNTTACHWDKLIPFPEMWERLNKLIKPNGAIVLFGSEPFSSALRMSNIKNYKYDWIWEKSDPSNFVNAKNMPIKSIENIIVFSEGTVANRSKKNMPYNPQGLKFYGKIVNEYRKKLHENSTGGNHHKRNHYQEWTNYPKQVLRFKNDKGKNKFHPTQKPVALMEYLIKTYTNEGETVLDFAMGSGTTGVACKNLNRNFIGIELDEEYFNIAKERINNLTK